MTPKNNREVIRRRGKYRRIAIAAEPAYRGCSVVTSVKNLNKAVLTGGMIIQTKFSKGQANYVLFWNSYVPSAVAVIKVKSREGRGKEIF